MAIIIDVYWAIGIVSVVVYLTVHYVKVAPLLKKHNSSGVLTWITNITHDKDLEKYKELCIKEKQSLFWYQFLNKINKYTIPYIIGWFITLLLSVVID